MKPLAILLMAAGASSRFGAVKQLALIDAKPLLQHSIDVANQVLPGSVYVVLGANARQIRPYISSANTIVNQQWSEGLGRSIACGVHHIEQTHRAVLIMLADQPLIQADHLHTMIKAQTGDNIVCAKYQGERGAPVIFPASCFAALKALSGDRGAKKLLQTTQWPVVELSIPEASVDIDTAADLSELVHHGGRY